MIRKIEHLGIAVKSLEESNSLFEKLLGRAPYKTEVVEKEGVSTSFFELGESKVELLEATGEASSIAKYINKRGEGIHHIALAVDDVVEETNRLQSLGFEPLFEKPRPGADNKLIMFFHPKSTNGVLVELCQEIPE